MRNRVLGSGLVAGLIFAASAAVAQDRQTGMIPTPPDKLKIMPRAAMPFSGAELPPSKDLSEFMPTPGDQGEQESCIGWATAYALKSWQEAVENKWDDKKDLTHIFSPAFVYNQLNGGQNKGLLYFDALNLIAKKGVASWADMPYNDRDLISQPSPSALANAAKYRINDWRVVDTAQIIQLKAQINAGVPVLIGVQIDRGFKMLGYDQVWRSFDANGPVGGHAMVVVGYDDARRAFKIMNSWGTGWGTNGYGWIDYDFFPKAVPEAYVVLDATNGPSPGPGPDLQPSTPAPTVNPNPVLPPTPIVASADFKISSVQHNVQSPYGLGMLFQGTVAVPPQVRGTLQIVITFAGVADGRVLPVYGTNPQFKLPQGQAATGTPAVRLSGSGGQTTWQAFLPYSALNVPHGATVTATGFTGTPVRTDLIAYPQLFLDNFGIKAEKPVPFYVNL